MFTFISRDTRTNHVQKSRTVYISENHTDHIILNPDIIKVAFIANLLGLQSAHMLLEFQDFVCFSVKILTIFCDIFVN